MTIAVGSGGAWKSATSMWVGVGGAWKKVSGLWVGVGGVWKQAWLNAILPDTIGSSYEATGSGSGTVFSRITVYSDGTYDTTQDPANVTWMEGGTGADYECRFTVTSGSLQEGTAGTWLSLSSNRIFGVEGTGLFVAASCVGTLEIRAAGTTDALDSSTVTLTATYGQDF